MLPRVRWLIREPEITLAIVIMYQKRRDTIDVGRRRRLWSIVECAPASSPSQLLAYCFDFPRRASAFK